MSMLPDNPAAANGLRLVGRHWRLSPVIALWLGSALTAGACPSGQHGVISAQPQALNDIPRAPSVLPSPAPSPAEVEAEVVQLRLSFRREVPQATAPTPDHIEDRISRAQAAASAARLDLNRPQL